MSRRSTRFSARTFALNTLWGWGQQSWVSPRPRGAFSGGDIPCYVFSTPSIFNMFFAKCILFHSASSSLASFLFLFDTYFHLDTDPHSEEPFYIFFNDVFFSPAAGSTGGGGGSFFSHSSFYLKFNGRFSVPLSSSLLWATAQRGRGRQVQVRRDDPALFRKGDRR